MSYRETLTEIQKKFMQWQRNEWWTICQPTANASESQRAYEFLETLPLITISNYENKDTVELSREIKHWRTVGQALYGPKEVAARD